MPVIAPLDVKDCKQFLKDLTLEFRKKKGKK